MPNFQTPLNFPVLGGILGPWSESEHSHSPRMHGNMSLHILTMTLRRPSRTLLTHTHTDQALLDDALGSWSDVPVSVKQREVLRQFVGQGHEALHTGADAGVQGHVRHVVVGVVVHDGQAGDDRGVRVQERTVHGEAGLQRPHPGKTPHEQERDRPERDEGRVHQDVDKPATKRKESCSCLQEPLFSD